MAARGSTALQFVPAEVYQADSPPENPAVGQLWRNTGVTPNELLAWTGKGTDAARRYAASRSGIAVAFEDLSDDRALKVTVQTVAAQAGSGAPSPDNARAISGRPSAAVTLNGVGVALTPGGPLYGLVGAEDEIASDGGEIHRTRYLELNGSEGWSDVGFAASGYFSTPLPAAAGASPLPLCSRFEPVASAAPDSNRVVLSGSELRIYPSDAVASTKAAFLSWLAANNVQVLYPLASPVSEAGQAVPMVGRAGVNTVSCDGAAVLVEYAGSGWAALGATQRFQAESVAITPEEGLRVDTTLVSADGAHQVPTYFNARGTKYGLFRASDGVMILGGMVLPSGQPAGVAGALVSPGATGETRIEIETASSGSGQARVDTAALHLVQPSLEGATDLNPAPTGEKVPVWFEAVRTTLLDADSRYIDNYNASIKALGSVQLAALNEGGGTLAWLIVERTAEGGLVHTDGAYAATDSRRTLANFAPRIQMSMPTSESIVYNATARRYMPDWKDIDDEYGRFQTFKGGNQSARDVGIVIQAPGFYRFVFNADLEGGSGSSGVVLLINRMPWNWMPPTTRNYCLDTDFAPSSGPARIEYHRATSAPVGSSVVTCLQVSEMWCEYGDKILPVVTMVSTSKTLLSMDTFFSAQRVG